jgi:hypothetical protein
MRPNAERTFRARTKLPNLSAGMERDPIAERVEGKALPCPAEILEIVGHSLAAHGDVVVG